MNPILPVYYQIKQTIKNWIINKEFNPGDRIPSEKELAAKFHVSRLTVRQAITQLVQEGLVNSKRGEGTFVTKNADLITGFSLEFTGFMDDLFYQISKSKTKALEVEKVAASKLIREKLGLDESEKTVVRIKRVRFLQDKAFAYTVNYLPLDIGKKISGRKLYKKPLLQIMEEDIGIKFTEAFQTVQASFADQEVSERLGIAAGSPILFVERIMYASGQTPVEFVQTSYRGDLYKYIVRLKNFRSKDANTWALQME